MSIRKRILFSVMAVALAGIVAGGLIVAAAVKTNAETSTVIDRSLTAIDEAHALQKALVEAKGLLAQVFDMTRLVDTDRIAAQFEERLTTIEATLATLGDVSQSEAMAGTVSALEETKVIWAEDARILMGTKPASRIPTAELMDRHAGQLQALSVTIATQADVDARTLSARSADTFLTMVAAAGALMLLMIGTASFFASRSARRISQSLCTVASRLTAMSGHGSDVNTGSRNELVAIEEAADALEGEMSAFQDNLGQTVRQAATGDLACRMPTDIKQESLRDIALQVNQLLIGVEGVFDETSRIMQEFARGNLNARVAGSHGGRFAELQGHVATTGEKLNELVGEIRRSAEQMQGALRSLGSGASGLSQRASAQAASLESDTATMRQLTATVQSNVTHAKDAETVAEGASQVAIKGSDIASNAIVAIQRVSESAKKISEITHMVDDIAFQTNLLALNAGVEAARAGAAGKGFAVVAHEVRALAGQAKNASQEITTLIGQSIKHVEEGVHCVEQTGQSLEDIKSNIARVSASTEQISDLSQQQADGLEGISGSMLQIGEGTQMNARLASESEEAINALLGQSARLTELVAFFDKESAADADWQCAATQPMGRVA